MEFRSAYSEKNSTPLSCKDDPGMTKQNHKDECDINLIIKKHDTQGVITHLTKMEAVYGDLTALDFENAANLVANAKSMFESLPSHARKEFRNDPGLFLDFCDNPANADKLVEMGLATRKETDNLHSESPEVTSADARAAEEQP